MSPDIVRYPASREHRTDHYLLMLCFSTAVSTALSRVDSLHGLTGCESIDRDDQYSAELEMINRIA